MFDVDPDKIVEDIPKLLASGILIPVLQFIASQAWQMRRKSRIVEIRKQIIELEEFIARYEGKEQPQPIESALALSKESRLSLFKELAETSTSFRRSHPTLSKLGSLLLLDRPKFFLTWFTRVGFYCCLIGVGTIIWSGMSDGFEKGDVKMAVYGFWCAVLWYLTTRLGDKATGEIVERPLWRRITLLYKPQSIIGGFWQILVLADISFLCWASSGLPAWVLMITVPFIILPWSVATHFDRNAQLRSSESEVAP